MLLKQNLRLYRVFKMTWKFDIVILGMCSVAYLVDTRLLTKFHLLPAMPTLIGTAIAFFIAFNNNQAYSRWWEARIIWGGIVNDSRSWARNLLAYCESEKTDASEINAKKMSLRHIGFLYALKASLRKTNEDTYKKYLPDEEV